MGLTKQTYDQAVLFFENKDPLIHKLLTKNGYLAPPPPRNLFANLIGCIIGQKVRYTVARKQRGNLYTELGTDDFTIDDMLNRSILKLQDSDIMDFTIDDVLG